MPQRQQEPSNCCKLRVGKYFFFFGELTMWHPTALLGVMILLNSTSTTQADSGHPVAVRWWGQAMVSIETSWDLTVVIDPYAKTIGYEDPQVRGDLVLITHEHGDHNNVDLVGGEPIVVRGLEKQGPPPVIDHVLDRWPNAPRRSWKSARLRMARTEHAVRVQGISSWHDDTEGSQRGANAMFLVEVDGVRLVHCGDLGQARLTDPQLKSLGDVDVLIIPVGGVYTVDGSQAANIVRQVNPRVVIPIHYKTPNLIYDLQGVQGFLAEVGDDRQVIRAKGNTLALSAAATVPTKPQVVVLDFVPQHLPAEWETLLVTKETACRRSQEVFASLTVEQMNFKPSNGTHTPRWNTEHMMGRELGFFSEIYAQIDPAVAKIDLNPKQMPPDYVAAHPDWSGEEEARQMERVSAFTRRFSYLLAELELDEQAPGSGWTPRRLLKQMERHYKEHTANVQKKFQLPDWPAR